MPNYSELYSLPSVSALSLPHYNSGSLNYLNYSKPTTRYPGVYKPHLSTISEINSPYRRINSPKLAYPVDISSRHIKPIKVINTSDIDVSVNKYKKYEKKSHRLKSTEAKTLTTEQLELSESKPKLAIKRDRITVRLKTVHTDTVKEEIGALKTWRDNFEPNELLSKVKTRKKTKGEILKEKFLIRSRSKENIPKAIEANTKKTIKKTSSFRDICTAITSENISDDLNPGQPVEVQRRQSKNLTSENLLKEIRRVSVEFTPEDFSLLNTILSGSEDIPAGLLNINDNKNGTTSENSTLLNSILFNSDDNQSKSSNTLLSTLNLSSNNMPLQTQQNLTTRKTEYIPVQEKLDYEDKEQTCIKETDISHSQSNILPTENPDNLVKDIKNTQAAINKSKYKSYKINKCKPLSSEADIFNGNNKHTTSMAYYINPVNECRTLNANIKHHEYNNKKEKNSANTDISNVEIEEIKFKIKPLITSSVEDITIPKKTLVAIVDNVEVEKKPANIEKKLKFNVTVKIDEAHKQIRKKEMLNKASIKEGKLIHPNLKNCLQNIFLQKLNNKQNCKKIKELTPVMNDNIHDHQVKQSCALDIVPDKDIVEQNFLKKISSKTLNEKTDSRTNPFISDNDKSNQSKIHEITETVTIETLVTDSTTLSSKLTSKRSLFKKSVKEDADLIVFIPPPETDSLPLHSEVKEEVFVPLQSNRLTQWMHPWTKPEQFDECPVEIFARPKIIRGRHYPRPRKRNGDGISEIPTNCAENETNTSDSDDSSIENTSTSLRSNDSGFGSTVPEKINLLQQEIKWGLCDNQQNTFVPPYDGKVIPPATTLPRFKKYVVEDFDFLKVIGKGSFGKVLLAKLKETDYYYAVKCLKKDVIIEDDDVECTLIERKVLALGTKHPFLCHLLCTLQTESHLFFVMEYLNGGDLMFHITTRGSFPEDEARFYSAEIISGLQFLHSKGIIYRDLKLDNILLDFDGHARLADFGMCQLQIFLDRMAESFCGTPDYMAPEIIKGQHYNQAVDWWSFGVLLYELFLGQSPFSGCDEDELFWSICNEKPVFPDNLSIYAIDLLTLLLEKDQTKRLGTRFSPHGPIREHKFYRKLDWKSLESRQIEPPFKPNVCHPLDTQYFDTNFTKETVKLSHPEVQKLENIDQSQFQGFSYTNPNATDK